MTGQGRSSIAIDVMGSDLGPEEIVSAVKLAREQYANLQSIILVGDEAQIRPALSKAGLEEDDSLLVKHASQVIEMEDKPLQALKQKRDSSMVRAIELVKEGEAQAVVSLGNTGSLMAGGTLRLRPMEGIERPALATVMPHKTGHFVLIDVGANPLAKAEHLVHNAILGSDYCRAVIGIENPRVGLLTIGTEEGKGNEITNSANELLKQIPEIINYSGLIEGFQIFEDAVDVIVCDGFTGNIVLKTCESLFNLLKNFVSEELKKTLIRQCGYLLSKGAFDAIKNQLNPERYGGAPLLGLNGNIIKAHGSSNREAIKSAIRIANEMVSKDLNTRISADIEKANNLIYNPTK